MRISGSPQLRAINGKSFSCRALWRACCVCGSRAGGDCLVLILNQLQDWNNCRKRIKARRSDTVLNYFMVLQACLLFTFASSVAID